MSSEEPAPLAGAAATGSPALSLQEQAKEAADRMNAVVMLSEMERQYQELRAERDDLEQLLQQSQKALREANQASLSSEKATTLVSQQKRDLQALQSQLEKTQEENKASQEKAARIQAECDCLRDEITKLKETNSELGAQVANIEIDSKLKESEVIPLMHERERLKTELESLQTHATWLQGELVAKTSAYQRLQHESHDRQLQLQLQLQQTENDKEAFAVREEELRKIEGRLQTQVEQLSRDMMLSKQELASVKESTALEIQQERKLVTMQKDHLVRWEQRYNDVVHDNEALKKAAGDAQLAIDQQLEEIRQETELKYKKLLEEQAAHYQLRIEQQQGGAGVARAAAALPAPTNDDNDDAPMGLTEVYERLEQAKAQLRQEKLRADRAELLNERIVKEIEEKTPLMNRQREEYELVMDQLQDYQSRLEQALQEKDEALADSVEARRAAIKWRRQYDDKTVEAQALAKQVQSLLLSRAGGQTQDGEITSVASMQSQNQLLVVENQRLQGRVNELTARLNEDEMASKLKAAKSELDSLRQQRKLQEEAVEKIIQQRDLYRSLCNVTGSVSSGQELTVQEYSKEQVERVRALKEELAESDKKIAALVGERDKLAREKQADEERLARYRYQNKELMESLSAREGELHIARGNQARSELEAKFHADKCVRLEESVQRHRDEISHVTSAKNELQRINAQLQHSLTEAKNLAAQKDTLVQQAETRLRLAETQAEAAKQAQKRATEEANQLRAEVARQGTLLTAVRRIESSLTAKSQGEIEGLKEEVQQLKSTSASDRKRYEVELKKLVERANAAEAQFQEAVKARDKALGDAASAKKALEKGRLSRENPKVMVENIAAQEKIDSLSTELAAAKAEISALQESLEQYKKSAKGSEMSVVDLSKAAASAKEAQQLELKKTKAELENVRKESASKDDVISEMTQSLAGAREEQETAVSALKGELASVKAELAVREKDLESINAALAAIKLDLETARGQVSEYSSSYERELRMHAEARSALRAAVEKSDNEAMEREKMAKELDLLKSSIEQERATWAQEKDSMVEATQTLETRLKESRDQIDILHSQVESLGTQFQQDMATRIDAAQGGDTTTFSSDETQKQLQEMRELIRFLRSENQMLQTQLDAATRSAEREKAYCSVLQHSVDEARAELAFLKATTSNDQSSGFELTAVKEQLVRSDEQVALLTDSNKLLREECQRLKGNLEEKQDEVDALQKQLKPAETLKSDHELVVATLNEEKISLRRELDCWKGRVEAMAKNLKVVDPEEHKKALDRVQALTAEKEAQEKWRTTTEEENKRIRDIARTLKQKVTEQNSQIEKLTAEKANSKEASFVKQRDELNAKLTKLEADLTNIKTELDGANGRNEKLRELLRQFQAQIRALKDKEQSLKKELEAAKSAVPKETPVSAANLPDTAKSSGTKSEPKPPPIETTTQKEPFVSDPSVPEGGFRYGPSPTSDKEPVDEVETKQAEVPGVSAIESARPAIKRRASGETAELSMRKKLLAKKRKLEELQKKRLEQATKKDSEVQSTEKEPDQSDKEEIDKDKAEDAKEETSLDKEVEMEEELNETEQAAESAPKPSADVSDEKPTAASGVTVKNPFAAGGPFGGSSTPPVFGQPASAAPVLSGGSFLDMKAPSSSSTPPTFTFGTSGKITLPIPAIPAPAPSPFSAFGGAATFGTTSFGAFSGGHKSSDPPASFAARPLFGSPSASADQGEEKNSDLETKKED